MKSSEIIKNTCCGQMLEIPVNEMARRVEFLEEALLTCHLIILVNEVGSQAVTEMVNEALNNVN